MRHITLILTAAVVASTTPLASAQSFARQLSTSRDYAHFSLQPVGMSQDGDLIVGNAQRDSFFVGLLWDSHGTLLSEDPGVTYLAISDDGSTLAVRRGDTYSLICDGTVIPLPFPNRQGPQVIGLSSDGRTVLGPDFVWTVSEGFRSGAAGGTLATEPHSLSGNGMFAAGEIPGSAPNIHVPARLGPSGVWERLPGFPSNFNGRAVSANSDGTVILVQHDLGTHLWREHEGLTVIPNWGDAFVRPLCLSRSGTALSAWVYYGDTTSVIWTANTGSRLLTDMAENSFGVQVYPWPLLYAWSMSRDLTTYLVATRSCDRAGGLILLHLDGPPACSADFNFDGFVDCFDYLDFTTAFEHGLPSADFNRDCFVDFFDYDGFVEAFEMGC